jgi:hypothetical protein
MKILKWIKMEFYAPQRNKAMKQVRGNRELADELNQKKSEKGSLSKRDEITMEYHYNMADVWQLELEKLEFKISQIEGGI